jgi:serine/threonine protein kinase
MLLLEYVAGWTLDDELVCDLVLPRRAVVVIGQVLRAVAHMHENGLMHGDVSPKNVLVGEGGDCKLTDYFVEPYGSFTVCGAPAYMAPEAVRGDAEQASDVWSIGCLMLVVTGRPPWQETEVLLEDGSMVDLGNSGALLFHLSCREIALKGPPEFAACGDSYKLPFFEMLVAIFTRVEERVSASELLVQNKWC